MSFEGKSQQEIGKWTEYCLKKENGPRASSAPALELNTIIFKHVFWYMQQISGERLQDHWSSRFVNCIQRKNPKPDAKTEDWFAVKVCNDLEKVCPIIPVQNMLSHS